MGRDNFIINECENCGFIYYLSTARCPVCGNMIMVAKKVTRKTWEHEKREIVKYECRKILARNKAKRAAKG